MGLDNHIEYAMKGILKNPILTVLKEIKIVNILKQSNFNKRNTGYPVFAILLHFVYMLVMYKRQSSFVKQSKDAKVEPLQKNTEAQLLIIDDMVEIKRAKQIEGSCKSLWSNKEHRCINGINIISLNFTDRHSTFQLDFAISMNKSKRKEVDSLRTPCITEAMHMHEELSQAKGKISLRWKCLNVHLNKVSQQIIFL